MSADINRNQIKLLLLKSCRARQSGFTMIEVLVGMIILTLFIGIAMQGMVFASLLKSRAQQYSEAMNWIQQDLEEIKYQATKYKANVLSANAAVNSTSIALSSADSFEVNDKIQIGTDTTTYTITNISGNALTISPNLAVDIPANSPVLATESVRCNKSATPATITTGFADGFRDRVVGSDLSTTSNYSDINKNSSKTGKQYRVRRTLSLANIAPYNVVQVNYSVAEIYGTGSFGISVVDLYAEVLPNTSFACPE